MKDLLLYYKTTCECGKVIEIAKRLTNQLPALKEHSITCECGIKIFTHIQEVRGCKPQKSAV